MISGMGRRAEKQRAKIKNFLVQRLDLMKLRSL